MSAVDRAAEVIDRRLMSPEGRFLAQALADAGLLVTDADARWRELCDEVGIPHDPDALVRHHRGNAGLTGAAEMYGDMIKRGYVTDEIQAVLDAAVAAHLTTDQASYNVEIVRRRDACCAYLTSRQS